MLDIVRVNYIITHSGCIFSSKILDSLLEGLTLTETFGGGIELYDL